MQPRYFVRKGLLQVSTVPSASNDVSPVRDRVHAHDLLVQGNLLREYGPAVSRVPVVMLEADCPFHWDAVRVLERDVEVIVILVHKPTPTPGHRGLGVNNVGDAAAALYAADVVPRGVESQDLYGTLDVLVLVADPHHPVYGLDALCPATGVIGHVDYLLQYTQDEENENQLPLENSTNLTGFKALKTYR